MSPDSSTLQGPVLPRVAITFCTQCRWMLRAAYFGQELLSTFGNNIGEIALIPATGGLFTVELTYHTPDTTTEGENPGNREPQHVLIWDRKTEGGFPETKVLKQLVRDRLQPDRDLGHSDRHGKKQAVPTNDGNEPQKASADSKPDASKPAAQECEDCK